MSQSQQAQLQQQTVDGATANCKTLQKSLSDALKALGSSAPQATAKIQAVLDAMAAPAQSLDEFVQGVDEQAQLNS